MTPRPPSARPLWLAPWFLGVAALLASAAPPDDAKFPPPAKFDPLPAVFDKARPESVADLRAIEEQTEKVYAKVKASVVCVKIGNSSGTGVIVTKDGYVLTAGHVSGNPGADVTFVFHDGKTAKGKSLGRNTGIDSGMVRLTDPGDWPAIEMGKSAEVKQGQWVMAVGHPGGYRVGRAPVLRLGRVLSTGASTVVHDCTIVGGDSGGPLFDMHGRVVGIESRIGTTLLQNTAVPVDPFRDQWDRLAAGESFRSGAVAGLPAQPPAAGNGALLGVQGSAGKDGAPLTLVAPGSPADKAGLMVKDVIKSIDGNAVKSVTELSGFIKQKKPGDEIALEVFRGDQTLNVKVVLGGQGGVSPQPGPGALPPAAPGASQTALGVMGHPDARECLLTQVAPGSAAFKAGLRADDVIRRFDGRRVESIDNLNEIVGKKKVGEEVDVEVIRNGESLTFRLAVGNR